MTFILAGDLKWAQRTALGLSNNYININTETNRQISSLYHKSTYCITAKLASSLYNRFFFKKKERKIKKKKKKELTFSFLWCRAISNLDCTRTYTHTHTQKVLRIIAWHTHSLKLPCCTKLIKCFIPAQFDLLGQAELLTLGKNIYIFSSTLNVNQFHFRMCFDWHFGLEELFVFCIMAGMCFPPTVCFRPWVL